MRGKLSENGKCYDDKKRTPTVRTPENIQAVRENIEASSSKSIRRLSQEAEVSATSTYRILRYDLSLFPYKIQVTHKLQLSDQILPSVF